MKLNKKQIVAIIIFAVLAVLAVVGGVVLLNVNMENGVNIALAFFLFVFSFSFVVICLSLLSAAKKRNKQVDDLGKLGAELGGDFVICRGTYTDNAEKKEAKKRNAISILGGVFFMVLFGAGAYRLQVAQREFLCLVGNDCIYMLPANNFNVTTSSLTRADAASFMQAEVGHGPLNSVKVSNSVGEMTFSPSAEATKAELEKRLTAVFTAHPAEPEAVADDIFDDLQPTDGAQDK